MQLEIFKWNLRQVFEVGGDLPGFRVWFDRTDQLNVDTEPGCDLEETVLITCFRFADIYRSFERFG